MAYKEPETQPRMDALIKFAKQETDLPKKLDMMIDILAQSGHCVNDRVLLDMMEEIKKLNVVLFGNGHPEDSVIARLGDLEDGWKRAKPFVFASDGKVENTIPFQVTKLRDQVKWIMVVLGMVGGSLLTWFIGRLTGLIS